MKELSEEEVMRYGIRPLVAWTDPGTRRARVLLRFTVLLASAVMAMSPAAAQARAVPSGVHGGALFGGTQRLIAAQGALHRSLAVLRDYYTYGQSFPDAAARQVLAEGGTVLASLDGGPSYKDVAAGWDHGYFRAFLTAMNNAAVQYHLGAIYFSYQHEADNISAHVAHQGWAGGFRAAWAHLHYKAREWGLNWNAGGHIYWTMIMMHGAFFPTATGQHRVQDYWVGQQEDDIIAVDGYNHAGCVNGVTQGIVTPGSLFGPALAYAASKGKPVFVAEWGSQRGPQQVPFIGLMQKYVTSRAAIKAAMYFDARAQGRNACDNVVNRVPASLRALSAMGADPGMQGRT
jgi:hypothetical protein